jgi:hypothetical protein
MIVIERAAVAAQSHARVNALRLDQTAGYLLWYFYQHALTWPEKRRQLDYGVCRPPTRVLVAFVRLTAEEWREPLHVLAARYPAHLCEPQVQQ